ncbi:putative inner membrane protein [Planctomycetes bacterium Poly30]|uniref:Putative inner membrane protein n=1 Tax=Saltatorellus ferox TaxID=2528018 RepID=A0A518EYG2_9BACT|nr:putative inner membrane protein [Planctomycetes bacterium Poly30]
MSIETTLEPPVRRGPLDEDVPGAERVWNPYLVGVGLGLTLLTSFVVLGAGLGASGSVARGSAWLAHLFAPEAVEGNAYLGPWFSAGSPLRYYLVFMGLGTFAGGLTSAWAANRIRPGVERGPRASILLRLVLALLGGLAAGFASRVAAGCTSGQALTGGALFLTGSWAFFLAFFGGAFLLAWFVRKEWS